MNRGITVLSLCDGQSCGQITLKELGYDNVKYYASEIEEHPITLTHHNFPNTIQLGDMTSIRYESGILYSENGEFEVGEIDLVIAGVPCQGFSVNGKKLNFEDDRSKLVFEYIRIRDEINPKYWLLENVATMNADVKELIDEYMGIKGKYINSNATSAQNRKRYYWSNIDFDELSTVSELKIKDILESDISKILMKKRKSI